MNVPQDDASSPCVTFPSWLSVALLMYKQGFRFWHLGYAAAIAFVLFVVILAATTLQVRLSKGPKGNNA